ncbi:MAG TPA: DUF4412 domain-containing protein [Thermoanaerobaculia bacterium]|nr:DUF4412 domain-containing protein [Thermoanaerobaculia bacterium]
MKRILAPLVLLVLCAGPLAAGMKYQFESRTAGRGGTSLVGTASVEGSNMRLDITEGDDLLFKDRAVVLSRDGGKTMIILDPREKTWFELSIGDALQAMGSMMKSMGGMFQMSIDNQTVDVKEAGDGGTIEGYPTRKYEVRTTYDLNMRIMGMKSASNVDMTTETWATTAIDPGFSTFVQTRGLRTGMEDLDALIAAQTASVKGFPLKQVTTTKTTQGRKADTQVTTMTVTGIEKASIPASEFEVPADYSQTESPLAAMDALRRR